MKALFEVMAILCGIVYVPFLILIATGDAGKTSPGALYAIAFLFGGLILASGLTKPPRT